MLQIRPGVLVLLMLAALITVNSTAAAQAQPSQDEQTLWKLEHSYWNYVQQNNLTAYLALWHKSFLGWPSVSAAPARKDHITDWITAQTSQGLTLKIIEFKPAAIQVTGDIAVTCYWMTFKWMNQDGEGSPHTIRVTHTLLRDSREWHIIGGMSMPEDANPRK